MLTHLYISMFCSNDIGVAGAEALASYMIEKPLDSLESLRLSYNNIADAGAKALSQAFVTNKCLTEISLKSNNINEVGLIAIGNSLFKNNTIQLLTLLGNHFDDNSAKLYGELERDRLPYINLWIDISVYVVDGVHLVAENR